MAHLLLVHTYTNQKWSIDVDQSGTARLELPAGQYRIWGALAELRRESEFDLREGCPATVVLELKFRQLQ